MRFPNAKDFKYNVWAVGAAAVQAAEGSIEFPKPNIFLLCSSAPAEFLGWMLSGRKVPVNSFL
jgi:hypothetical protein